MGPMAGAVPYVWSKLSKRSTVEKLNCLTGVQVHTLSKGKFSSSNNRYACKRQKWVLRRVKHGLSGDVDALKEGSNVRNRCAVVKTNVVKPYQPRDIDRNLSLSTTCGVCCSHGYGSFANVHECRQGGCSAVASMSQCVLGEQVDTPNMTLLYPCHAMNMMSTNVVTVSGQKHEPVAVSVVDTRDLPRLAHNKNNSNALIQPVAISAQATRRSHFSPALPLATHSRQRTRFALSVAMAAAPDEGDKTKTEDPAMAEETPGEVLHLDELDGVVDMDSEDSAVEDPNAEKVVSVPTAKRARKGSSRDAPAEAADAATEASVGSPQT